MKIKYNHKILFFFIFVSSFIIIYYCLGKLYSKPSTIEGNTSNSTLKKSSNDTADTIEMKQKIKIMNKYITTNVEPKVNKMLEKIKVVSEKTNANIKKNTDSKINSFGTKNSESKRVYSQKKFPPFSSSEISNSI
jgi:hypothetical protein